MVGPEACTEVRYPAHAKQIQALELIPQVAAEFWRVFERDSGGLIKSYRTDDAQTIVIALGSVLARSRTPSTHCATKVCRSA